MLGETLLMLALGGVLATVGWFGIKHGIALQEAGVAFIRGKRAELGTIDATVARFVPVVFLVVGSLIFLFALLLLVLMAVHALL